MRRWAVLLIVLGLLPTAFRVATAGRVAGGYQSLDVTDNVVAGGVVTGALNVSGVPTFADNTVNGADLIDNTVGLGKIEASGTKDNTTFLRGDGKWSTVVTGRGALVYNTAPVSIPNSAQTLAQFDSESYDTDTIHSTTTDNTKLAVPAGVSVVRVSAQVVFYGNNVGARRATFLKNGAEAFAGNSYLYIPAAASGFTTIMHLDSAMLSVSPGDYFELRLYQSSGGALSIETSSALTWFAMEIIK